jgi:ParB family transcriptional regulator, chromosome partitioning protein
MHPTSVPYAKLVLNPAINARGELTDADVADLVASIPTEGLLQPLLVRPYGETMYEIVEGSRRHRAINILIDKDLWKIETEVPVLCRDMTDEEAREASLLANIQRLDLAPAEEAIAFTKLEADGQTPDAIAAHFGSSTRYVKQRLAIGKLPLPILNALADGTISVEAAQAFTLSANEGLQLQVFNDLGNGNRYHASSIRDALVKKSVQANSREAKFVGEFDYVEAGGAVTRDLFSENVFFEDGPLLHKLFDVKIEEARAGLLEAGWSDVIIARDGKPRIYDFERSKPQDKNLSEETRARLATIKGELDDISTREAEINSDDNDDTDCSDEMDAMDEKRDQLEAEQNSIRAEAFTIRQKKKCIAIIEIDYSTVNFHLGLIDPKQAKKKKGSVGDTPDDDDEFINTTTKSTANFEEADFTGALRDEMSITMDTALRATMMQKPQAAWYCLLASMVMAAQSNGYNAPLHTAQARYGASDVNDLVKSLFQAGEDEEDDSKPWNFADILTKLESLDAEVLGKLSGGLIARHLNVMKRLIDANVQALITRMDPDVIKIWQPDLAFFKKLKAADLTEGLIEINHGTLPEGVSAKAKKAELVVKAAGLAPAAGWLPKPLRTASYLGPGSDHYKSPEAEAAPVETPAPAPEDGGAEAVEAEVETADQELEAA